MRSRSLGWLKQLSAAKIFQIIITILLLLIICRCCFQLATLLPFDCKEACLWCIFHRGSRSWGCPSLDSFSRPQCQCSKIKCWKVVIKLMMHLLIFKFVLAKDDPAYNSVMFLLKVWWQFVHMMQSWIYLILAFCFSPIIDRLVELCLLENEGVLQLARELGAYHESKDSSNSLVKLTVSRVAQLVASVPDKARLGAPKSLSSQYPFHIQLNVHA